MEECRYWQAAAFACLLDHFSLHEQSPIPQLSILVCVKLLFRNYLVLFRNYSSDTILRKLLRALQKLFCDLQTLLCDLKKLFRGLQKLFWKLFQYCNQIA